MTDETQEHAQWSPSSAHRWRRCAASMKASRGIPDRVGREAAEGTVFHDHAELALRFGLPARSFVTGIMQIINGHEVCYNDEMIEHLENGLEYVYSLLADPLEVPLVYVEERVKIERWTGEKGGFGTSDLCIIFVRQRRIVVFDWKYGKVAVSPIENDQEELYGLGCWDTFAGELFDWNPEDIDVEFIIYQPRVPEGGGSWGTTMEWLLEEGEKIRRDADATREENPVFTPGTIQCKYCRYAPKCAALAKYNLAMFSLRFEDIDEDIDYGMPHRPPDEPDFGEWTPERRSYVLLHWKVFKRWHEMLLNEARRDAVEGRPVPFMKMVDGRGGIRVFRNGADKEAAKRFLVRTLGEAKAIKKELLSVAEAEKILGKKRFKEDLGEYVYQPQAKPSLVPETDPRPAKLTHGEKFDSLFGEDDSMEDDED